MDTKALEKQLNTIKFTMMQNTDLVFFCNVFFLLNFVWNDDDKTAYLSGRTLGFSIPFWKKLENKHRMFVILHEVMHYMYEHCTRVEDRNHKLFNAACDYCINWQLVNLNNLAMPSMGLYDDRFADMDAYTIYDILDKECDNRDKDQFADELGEGFGDDFDKSKQPSQKDKEDFAELIQQAAVQCAVSEASYGSMSSDLLRVIEECTTIKVDWYTALINHLTELKATDYSYQRPNMNFGKSKIIFPTLGVNEIGTITVYIDVSGSVTTKMFTQFIAELNNLKEVCHPSLLTIIGFDTELGKTYEFSEYEEIAVEDLTGWGGTYIEPVLADINNREDEVVVILTDGEFYIPSTIEVPECSSLYWLIYNNPRFSIDVGEVITYEL